MQVMLDFWSLLLHEVVDFCMSEPVIWFVAVFLLFAVGKLVNRIIN